ncbi:hypothetical protein L208DRAFT_1271305, partial [Tricholoma matsutake]
MWQAFVQESICTIAASADTELSVWDNLAIGEITKEAFSILGENGVIRAADQHACSECTHDYIATTADTTPTALSAAVVGVDEVEPSSPQPADSSSSSSSGSTSASTWERAWEMTTRFIVDACHYINHRDDDELCKKWCNPAP